MRIAKGLGLVFLLMGIAACRAVQIDPPEARTLVDSCQRLAQPAYLIKHERYRKGGFKGEHLIITEPFRKNHLDDIVGPLETGTRLKVRRVLKDVNYTASCWRIEVEVASGPLVGAISQLPACFGHPPSWLSSENPLTPVEDLRIKPEYAVPCATEPVQN